MEGGGGGMVDKVKLNQEKKNLLNFLFQIFLEIIRYTRP